MNRSENLLMPLLGVWTPEWFTELCFRGLGAPGRVSNGKQVQDEISGGNCLSCADNRGGTRLKILIELITGSVISK